MDASDILRRARRRTGISQAALAAQAGTSQPTISAYESGAKVPSAETLARLLAECGMELAARPAPRMPSRDEFQRSGRTLSDVLALAESLPFRRAGPLAYPRLPGRRG